MLSKRSLLNGKRSGTILKYSTRFNLSFYYPDSNPAVVAHNNDGTYQLSSIFNVNNDINQTPLTFSESSPNLTTRVHYAGISINNSKEVSCLLIPYFKDVWCNNIYTGGGGWYLPYVGVFAFLGAKNVTQLSYYLATKAGEYTYRHPTFPVTAGASIGDNPYGDNLGLTGWACPGYPNHDNSIFVNSVSLPTFDTHFPGIAKAGSGTKWQVDVNIYEDISYKLNK